MVLQSSTSNTVINIWEYFKELSELIGTSEFSDNDFFEKAKSWVNLFASLKGKRKGYESARITPYIHVMVYHIPNFLRTNKAVKLFTGQGVEKNNDYARIIVLRKSLNLDAASDVFNLKV